MTTLEANGVGGWADASERLPARGVTMYYLLFYDYVENAVERRAPHRVAHLQLVGEWASQDRLVLGGAFAEPVDGAVLVFKVDDRRQVEQFVGMDPYVSSGLVTRWRIRPWTVVVGSALANEHETG